MDGLENPENAGGMEASMSVDLFAADLNWASLDSGSSPKWQLGMDGELGGITPTAVARGPDEDEVDMMSPNFRLGDSFQDEPGFGPDGGATPLFAKQKGQSDKDSGIGGFSMPDFKIENGPTPSPSPKGLRLSPGLLVQTPKKTVATPLDSSFDSRPKKIEAPAAAVSSQALGSTAVRKLDDISVRLSTPSGGARPSAENDEAQVDSQPYAPIGQLKVEQEVVYSGKDEVHNTNGSDLSGNANWSSQISRVTSPSLENGRADTKPSMDNVVHGTSEQKPPNGLGPAMAPVEGNAKEKPKEVIPAAELYSGFRTPFDVCSCSPDEETMEMMIGVTLG
ncbi:hypothetical protein NDN08_003673 [Rhodosorus marinus]|uniref:Uncharacterized protein n=1 Tax=Rhodosorus marinus TaxID=101924 RepID=A0AAV8V1F6_9RHOD|nr:hypothetical protein NDN08_003673 [Rhodosorus marinus]